MPSTKEVGAALKESVEKTAAKAEGEETEETPVEPEPVEPDEDEEAAEEETPAEPEPEGRSDKATQAMFNRAMQAFKVKLGEVFGVLPDEIQAAPYPGVIGFMLPGYGEPKTHPDFIQCSTCNGRGKILTGAFTGDETKDWHTCPDMRCKGNGYWQRAQPQAQTPTTGPLAVVAPSPPQDEYAEAPAWMGDPQLSAGA